MSMEELFKDKAYCNTQIVEARKQFGNVNTTDEQLDKINDTLAFMYIYCPDELQSIVLATMNELEKRRLYRSLYCTN
jgi:hypothetical protein